MLGGKQGYNYHCYCGCHVPVRIKAPYTFLPLILGITLQDSCSLPYFTHLRVFKRLLWSHITSKGQRFDPKHFLIHLMLPIYRYEKMNCSGLHPSGCGAAQVLNKAQRKGGNITSKSCNQTGHSLWRQRSTYYRIRSRNKVLINFLRKKKKNSLRSKGERMNKVKRKRKATLTGKR